MLMLFLSFFFCQKGHLIPKLMPALCVTPYLQVTLSADNRLQFNQVSSKTLLFAESRPCEMAPADVVPERAAWPGHGQRCLQHGQRRAILRTWPAQDGSVGQRRTDVHLPAAQHRGVHPIGALQPWIQLLVERALLWQCLFGQHLSHRTGKHGLTNSN